MNRAGPTTTPTIALAGISVLASAPAMAMAMPIEGDLRFNATGILVVLGVTALLLGLRNWRALRHKPLARRRRPLRTAPFGEQAQK